MHQALEKYFTVSGSSSSTEKTLTSSESTTPPTPSGGLAPSFDNHDRDEKWAALAELYNSINAMDLSTAPTLTEPEKRVMRAVMLRQQETTENFNSVNSSIRVCQLSHQFS
jgi:hypothetical protein